MLDVPTEHNLCWGDPICHGNLDEHGIVEAAVLERAVSLEDDVAMIEFALLPGIVEERAPTDLIDLGGIAGRNREVIDLFDAVVAYPITRARPSSRTASIS